MKEIYLQLILLFCSFSLFSQPTVDGDLSDPEYISLATKLNANAGFGSNIDVTEIVYYSDVANSKLYIGVKGKLDTGSDNGIGLFLNLSEPTGAAANSPLGFSGAGHYIDGQGGGTNDDFKGNFEVDYMFAVNPGNGTTSVFLDAASLVGGNTADFVGTASQTGSVASDSDLFGTGSAASYAFNNGGGASQGLEIEFDYAALGISSPVGASVQAVAFVVSSSGFFSDVTVPGNISTGNLGFNACLVDMSLNLPLPIDLADFNVKNLGSAIELKWSTTSEVNNSHFDIQRSSDASKWSTIGRVEGKGTTFKETEYSYIDREAKHGLNYYRLEQVDYDGASKLYQVKSIYAKSPRTNNSLRIFPNVVENSVNVIDGKGKLSILDSSGRLLKNLSISEEFTTIDLSNLRSGSYILRIDHENGEIYNHWIFK